MSTRQAQPRFQTSSALSILTMTLVFMQPWASAHTSLEKYLRQEVSVAVGAHHIDVRLHWVFPSDISLKERRLMDADGDGALSSEEKSGYLNALQERAEKQVRLLVDGQAMMLIPLEDPVLDLQGAPGIEAHPHELRLAWFVRVPATFGVGGTIAVESELWTDRPLMLSVTTETVSGIHLKKTEAKGLRYPKQDTPVCRLLEARCTAWSPGSVERERTKR